jgi:hypothetical protein
MFPIDVSELTRRGTLGARITDPTIPYRPSYFSRLTKALRARKPEAAIEECAQRSAPRRRAQPNSSPF